jgi:hypothetical protein
LEIAIDDYNDFLLTLDFNKLLVPSPPIYALDSNGLPILNPDGSYQILSGKNNDVPVATAIFQSFTDAPGNIIGFDENGNPIIEKGSRFREELREINPSVGVEYWYDKQFAVRAGYFYEHPTKGNRQYFTLGIGLALNVFSLDISYLIPTVQRHPLANTLRFSLAFSFEELTSNNSGQ